VKSQKVYFSTFRLFENKLYLFLLFDFSTFRNSKRYLFTFRLFVFRLFEFQNNSFPPGALHLIFPPQLPYPCFKKNKVAAHFSTQFSRIHTGTCPAIPIAHAATCSLCGVCCCPEHARILWFNSRDQGVGEATVLKQCHARAISQKTLVNIFLRAWAHLVVTINTGLNNFLQRHLWTWIHDFAQSKHKSD